jgi:hypothetical protein
MMANATNAGSNLYSTEWSGPPATSYSLSGMSSALGALIVAIGPTSSPDQTASGPSSSGSAASRHHGVFRAHLCAVHGVIFFLEHPSVPHGAVIGIVIAGATAVCLTVAYIITRAYRKSRQTTSAISENECKRFVWFLRFGNHSRP